MSLKVKNFGKSRNFQDTDTTATRGLAVVVLAITQRQPEHPFLRQSNEATIRRNDLLYVVMEFLLCAVRRS